MLDTRGLCVVGSLMRTTKVTKEDTGEIIPGLFEVVVDVSMRQGGNPVERSIQFYEADNETGLPTLPFRVLVDADDELYEPIPAGTLVAVKCRAWVRRNFTIVNYTALSVETVA